MNIHGTNRLLTMNLLLFSDLYVYIFNKWNEFSFKFCFFIIYLFILRDEFF